MNAEYLNQIVEVRTKSAIWRINSTLAHLISIARYPATDMSSLGDLTNCSYCIQRILINLKRF